MVIAVEGLGVPLQIKPQCMGVTKGQSPYILLYISYYYTKLTKCPTERIARNSEPSYRHCSMESARLSLCVQLTPL